jgi:hypothetical protein
MNRNRSRKAKPFRAVRGKKTSVKKNEKKLEIQLVPSFARQVCWDTWLPGLPVKATTTVTTGVIAASYVINKSNLQGFATRFASTFDEYRIVQARFLFRMFSSVNPGTIMIFIDENSTGVPVLAEAQERFIINPSASDVGRTHQLSWTAADPQDLLYNPLATGFTPATMKVYTDNANFGSSIVATDYFEMNAFFRIQFRGLAAV